MAAAWPPQVLAWLALQVLAWLALQVLAWLALQVVVWLVLQVVVWLVLQVVWLALWPLPQVRGASSLPGQAWLPVLSLAWLPFPSRRAFG